jgi:hypothetical protein
MTLFTVLLNLNQFPEQHNLYVQRPWTLESETLVQSHEFNQLHYAGRESVQLFSADRDHPTILQIS